MSSLTDLNNAANQTLQFDDDREPNVVFNIYLEQTQFDFTSVGTEFAVLFPLDILEIDNVAAANVRFRISVPSNYTVDFSGLASNLSLSQTGTDYTISGITGLADWLTLKDVVVGIPGDLEGQAAYTASILWNTLAGPQTYTWNVGVFRPVGLLAAEFDVDSTPGRIRRSGSFQFVRFDLVGELEPFYLSIPAQDIFYGMNQVSPKLGVGNRNPVLSAPFDPVWTLTIQPSELSAITEISLDSIVDPGFSFNFVTKTATLIGNTATVNAFLSDLVLEFGTFESPFDLVYTLENDIRPGVGSTNQRFIPITQGFLNTQRRFNNTLLDGSGQTADSNIFENAEAALVGFDPAQSITLTISVLGGTQNGNLRWATNISPLVYSSRTQTITISGTPDFINARLQGNRIQHRASNNLSDPVPLLIQITGGISATIDLTPRFAFTSSNIVANFNSTATATITAGAFLNANVISSIQTKPNAVFNNPIIISATSSLAATQDTIELEIWGWGRPPTNWKFSDSDFTTFYATPNANIFDSGSFGGTAITLATSTFDFSVREHYVGTQIGFNNNRRIVGFGSNSNNQRTTPADGSAFGTLDNTFGVDWKSVAAGNRVSFGISNDGKLWVWGDPNNLANPSTTQNKTQIGTDTNWLQVISVNNHCLALKTNGTLWAWGNNSNGQLGLNDTTNRPNPTQVNSDTNWRQITLGRGGSSFAVKTNGTLWAWGNNSVGQLGLGDTTNRLVPTQVGTDTNWRSVFGLWNNFAVKTNGTLWAWGNNSNGQLGLGDTVDRSVPTQVGTDTDWRSISCGRDHTNAIKTDGTLWGCGFNRSFGNWPGVDANQTTFVQVSSETNWRKIYSGLEHTIALRKT
jgi:hypothetical protein